MEVVEALRMVGLPQFSGPFAHLGFKLIAGQRERPFGVFAFLHEPASEQRRDSELQEVGQFSRFRGKAVINVAHRV
ncbi:MAG: hypothetical protein ABSF64_31805 [Bryobacteraceae bacterium]